MCVTSGARFTGKKIANRRYNRTENNFLMGFLEKDGNVTVTELARMMGVARSTFYYHHKNLPQAVRDYKVCVLSDYCQLIQKMFDKNTAMMKIFLGMLVFMMSHRRAFLVLVRVGVKDVFVEMVEMLRPKVEKFAKLPKDSEKIFNIYVYEVAGILKIWVEEGMPEEKMKIVLDDLMYLTNTINERLGFLEREH